jgi:hypothetical protein
MSSEFRHRASLVLNVILAATALMLALRKPEPPTATPVVEVTASKTTRKSSSTDESPRYPNTAPAADQRRWLVDQLRAMGVPNKVLAQVVLKDLDQRWNKHAAEVSLKCHGNPEIVAALQLEIERNMGAEMRAALGEEGFKEWDTENMRREVNRGRIELTPSETDAAYTMWKKLQERELELKESKLKGEMDEADANEAYAKDVSAAQLQLKALLGDERYAQAQGHGDAAADLRQDVAKVNPNDFQFQQLLKAQQEWNDRRAELEKQSHDDLTHAEQLKALESARDEEYRRVLGAELFDALQKGQDPGYSEMKKHENIWGLDDAKIDYVYGTMKYYEKSVDDYKSQARAIEAQGQNVDWNAVNVNLQQFTQQIQQGLQAYLGQASFDKMQRNGIFQLSQTPPRGRPQ